MAASEKDVAMLFAEAGMLRRINRSSFVAFVDKPENVAEHAYRAMLVGRVLAEMENADAARVTSLLLYHDLPEARLGDLNTVQKNYIESKPAEARVVSDQAKRMPPGVASEYTELMREYAAQATREAIVARDADLLENALTAIEFRETGHKIMSVWVENVKAHLKTESAKKLIAAYESPDVLTWWKSSQKVSR